MDIGTARGNIEIETGQAIQSLNQLVSALNNVQGLAGSALQEQGRAVQQVGQGMQRIGTVMTGVGVAMGVPFVAATKAAIDFESQMAGVNAVMDINAEQYENLSGLAQQLGSDTIFSGTESARAIETLGKAGISYENIMGGAAKASTDLAAAAEMGTEAAADTIAAGIQAFGLSGDEAVKVADAIAGAANSSLASASDLAMGLGNVGSTAAGLGMDIYDTAAALAVLTDRGQSGTDAATTLRTALQFLVAPSTTMAAEQEKLGLSVYDATGQFKGLEQIARELDSTYDALGLTEGERIESMKRLVGQDGMRALLGMTQAINNENIEGAKGIDDYNEAVREQGAAAKFAEDRMDSTAGSIERLTGSIATLGERAGASILGFIRPIIDGLDMIVDAVASIPGPILGAITTIGALGAALLTVGGAALVFGGQIVQGIGYLQQAGYVGSIGQLATQFGSLLKILTAVGIAIAAIAIAWENDFLGMRTAVEDFLGGVGDAANKAYEFQTKFQGMDDIPAKIYSIGAALDALGFDAAGKFVQDFSKGLQDAIDFYEKEIEKRKDPNINDPNGIGTNRETDKALADTVSTIDQIAVGLNAAAKISDKLFGSTSNLSKGLRSASKAVDAYGTAWQEMIDSGGSGAQALFSGLAAGARELGLSGLGDFFDNVNKSIFSFQQGVGNLLAGGINPFSAVLASLGVQLEYLTGLPVGEWAVDTANSIQKGVDVFDSLIDQGVQPVQAAFAGLGVAMAELFGDNEWINRMNKAGSALGAFGDTFQEAINSGLNPFHAALLGLAEGAESFFGEGNIITNGIEGMIGAFDAAREGIGQFGEDFINTFNSMTTRGMNPLSAAITAFARAFAGEGFIPSEALTGILTFIDTLGALKDALLAGDWSGAGDQVRSAINQIVGAVQTIDIGQITATVSGWVIESATSLWDTIKTWALGGGPSGGMDENGIGTNRESTGALIELGQIAASIGSWLIEQAAPIWNDIQAKAAELVQTAQEVVLPAISATISGWIVSLAAGASDLIGAVRDWALGTSYAAGGSGGSDEFNNGGGNTGAVQVAVGAITATVSGWLVQLAEGAVDLATRVKEWALGNGDNQGSYTNSYNATGGNSSALVQLGEVTASVAGFLIEGGSTLFADIVRKADEWTTNLSSVPINEVTVSIGKFLVEAGDTIADAISRFLGLASDTYTPGGAGGSDEAPTGSASAIPIGDVAVQIGKFVVSLASGALDVMGEVMKFVDDAILGYNYNEGDLENSEELGQKIGTALSSAIESAFSSGTMQTELESAARVAGQNFNLLDVMNAFLEGAQEGMGVPTLHIDARNGKIQFLSPDEAELAAAEAGRAAGPKVGEAYVKNIADAIVGGDKTPMADVLAREGTAIIKEGLGNIEIPDDVATVDIPNLSADAGVVGVDAGDAAIDLTNPPEGVVNMGVPLGVTADGYVFEMGSQTVVEPSKSLKETIAQGLSTGEMVLHPVKGLVDPSGAQLYFNETGPINMPMDGGQPLIVTNEHGVVVDAAGNPLTLTPETQQFIQEQYDAGIFDDNGPGTPIHMLYNGKEVIISFPDSSFTTDPNTPGQVGNAVDGSLSGGVREIGMPKTEAAIGEKGREAVANGITSLPNAGTGSAQTTGTGIATALDGLIAGQISEADFSQVVQTFGSKMAQVFSEAFTSYSSSNLGPSGQMQDGGIGNQLMTNLATSITTANTEGLSTALKTKISEALSTGLSAEGGEAANAAQGAAGGIGSSIVSSLVTAITGADFTAIGQAISSKISQALSAGLSQGGATGSGPGGGQGAAAGAGSGIATSIVNSITSSIAQADFSSIGTQITSKIAAGMGTGTATIQSALSAVIGAVVASGQGVTTQAMAIGAAIVTNVGAGMGQATGTVQSALSAVISAVVASAAGATAGATQIGAQLVTTAASGVGGATGTFQSAVTAMVGAVVASGVADAGSQAPQIGEAVASNAGSGVGGSTETFISAINAMVSVAVEAGSGTASTEAPAIGSAFSAGAAAGIDISAMVQPAIDMVNAAIEAAKQAAAIASPSKRMRDEVGVPLAEGAAVGVDEEGSLLSGSVRGMVEKSLSAVDTFKDAKSRIKDALSGVGDSANEIGDIAGSMQGVAGASDLSSSLQGISDGVKETAANIRSNVEDLVSGIREQIESMAAGLRGEAESAGEGVGEGLASGVSSGASEATASVRTVMKDLMEQFNIAGIKDSIKVAKEGIIDTKALKQNAADLEELSSLMQGVPGFEQLSSELATQADEIRTKAGEARDGFRDVIVDLRELMKSQMGAIRDLAKEMVAQMRQVGSEMASATSQGMAEGSASSGDEVAQSAKDLASKYGADIGSGMDTAGQAAQQGASDLTGSDIPAGLEQGTPSMEAAGQQVGTDLANSVEGGMQTGTEGAVGSAGAAGDQLGDSFTSGVASNIPDAQQLGSQISTAVLESLKASSIADSEAVRMIGEAFGTAFGSGVESTAPEAQQAGQTVSDAASTGLQSGTETASQTAQQTGQDIGSSLGEGISNACAPVQSAGQDLTKGCAAEGIESGAGAAENTANRAGKGIGNELGDGLNAAEKPVGRDAENLGADAADGIAEGVRQGANLPVREVDQIVSKMTNVNSDTQAKPIGVDVVDGLIAGLNNKEGALYDKVKEIVDKAIKAAKDAAKSDSPSKRTMELGEDMGIGLAMGVDNEATRPIDAMTNLVNGVMNAAQIGDIKLGTFMFDEYGSGLTGTLTQMDKEIDRLNSKRMYDTKQGLTGTRRGSRDNATVYSGDTYQFGDINVDENTPGAEDLKRFISAQRSSNSAYMKKTGRAY